MNNCVALHGLDDVVTGLWQAGTGVEQKNFTYQAAMLASGGNENVALGVDLAAGLLMPGADDALRLFGKGEKIATALTHSAKRVGVASGFAGAGFALGATGENGSWERGLQYAGIGASLGQLAANYAVACFTAGTPIVIAHDGSAKLVELFEENDLLLARDEHDPNGPLVLKRIEEIFVRVAPVIDLIIRGRAVGTTAEHPFYVVERNDFVAAGEIEVGETFLSHDGQLVKLEGVRDTGNVANVYNFRIADFHTYFVGGKEWGFSVWVHNASYPVSRTNWGWRDASGRFTKGPAAVEMLSAPRTFHRGSRNFVLEQGNATSGWKHIWDRHVHPTRFVTKTKFELGATEDDIFQLLNQTIKHGKETSYAGQTVFTKRIRQGANTSWYRATMNPDGTVQTFHALD